jgi:HSP20 family protein
VKATGRVKPSARPFPFLHPIDVLDPRDPEIQKETEGGARDFEDAAHGYDCRMRSRKDIDRLKLEMEELFADLCQVPRLVASRRGFRPAVDVYRTEDPPAVTVLIELAGVDPATTELVLADGILVIRGIRRRSAGEQRVVHMEIDYGPFERQIPIAEPVDAEAAEATYSRGLLVVTFPLAERPTRKLSVQISTKGSA